MTGGSGVGSGIFIAVFRVKYRKDLQISYTFFPKICDQNRRCGLSARPFGEGAVNFREWTLLWHNTGINATLQQQESIGHCFCEFGGS